MAKAKNDKKNTADIGFEKQLWAAATSMPPNIRTSYWVLFS